MRDKCDAILGHNDEVIYRDINLSEETSKPQFILSVPVRKAQAGKHDIRHRIRIEHNSRYQLSSLTDDGTH